MSNLAPKKIVDKNGVLTTRMVRIDKAPVKTSVPSPSVEPAPFTDEAYEIAMIAHEGALINMGVGYSEAYFAQMIAMHLTTDEIKVVHDRVMGLAEEDVVEFGKYMVNVLRVKAHVSQRYETMLTLIDALPVVRRFNRSWESASFFDFKLAPLQDVVYVNNVGQGATDEDGDLERAAVQYLTFRYFLRGANSRVPNLQEEAKWFNENHEALIPYADLLRERGTDFGFLQELVNGDAAAPLASGVL